MPFKKILGFFLQTQEEAYLWQKQKMKVSIATQTLSASVTHALDFCRVDMAVEAFAGCKSTSDFIRNSRNPFGHGNKVHVSLQNFHTSSEKCDAFVKYIFTLNREKGNFLRTGQKKTVICRYVFQWAINNGHCH